jgi:hypothetical protein
LVKKSTARRAVHQLALDSALNWVLMIVGGFFFSVILFLLGIFIFDPKDDNATQRPKA